MARCADPKPAFLRERVVGRGVDELLRTVLSAWEGKCLQSLTLALGMACETSATEAGNVIKQTDELK